VTKVRFAVLNSVMNWKCNCVCACTTEGCATLAVNGRRERSGFTVLRAWQQLYFWSHSVNTIFAWLKIRKS